MHWTLLTSHYKHIHCIWGYTVMLADNILYVHKGLSFFSLAHPMQRFNDKQQKSLCCPHFYELELGPLLLPNPVTTLTKRRLYCMRRLARPVFFFFFSCLSTLGVCPFTFPARAREPWTLPPSMRTSTCRVVRSVVQAERHMSSSRGWPQQYTARSAMSSPSRAQISSLTWETVSSPDTSKVWSSWDCTNSCIL